MSNYQSYDFMKDIDIHIKKQIPIDLKDKSEIFKTYLFKLKLYQLNKRIKKSDPMFDELYCLVTKDSKVYVAKRLEGDTPKFEYVEIIDAIKVIRKRKLNKLFPE